MLQHCRRKMEIEKKKRRCSLSVMEWCCATARTQNEKQDAIKQEQYLAPPATESSGWPGHPPASEETVIVSHFHAESLIEWKAENWDNAAAVCGPPASSCACRLRTEGSLKLRASVFRQLYLSMMSAMTQANICRPSGSCRATVGGGEGKHRGQH